MAITNRYEGDLLELAKKYGIENYTLGQDFNSHKGKMSASDYDLSNKLLNYYNQEKAAIDQHNAAVQKIDDNTKKQIEDAQINRTKATHYLQNYNNANGLGGLGMAQSSLIDLYSNYQNQRAGIMGQADSSKLDLENKFNTNSNTLHNQYLGDVNEQKEEYSEVAFANTNIELNNMLVGMIGADGKVSESDMEKINKWAEEKKNELVGRDLYEFEKTIESIQVRDKKNVESIVSGKESVLYDGNEYKIKEKLNKDSNEIKRNNDFKAQIKEKFGTTNPYDSKIPNGTVLEIKCDKNGANDFNFWDDFGKFLISPLGHGAWSSWANSDIRYVTYYNGEWYLSDKQ